MFARALIVVLIALNLGVGAWWWLRPAPETRAVPDSDKGGVALQLIAPPVPAATSPVAADGVDENPPATAPATPAVAATTTQAVANGQADAAVDPPTCRRMGPFGDRAAAEAARSSLEAVLRQPRLHEEPGQAARYRVLLPPAADRAQAQATAARITAAGFDDLFILAQGEEANGIALGAYSNSDAAERRAAALRAAGFPVQVRPQGAASASRWWLLGVSDTPAKVRAAFPAARELDCATLSTAALR